ncbi:MAG: hypothetical protein Ct9H90mV3_250 [uncultured marine virus]|nr:MAG: hypothetical protein Ct9H90mV3_250 [uncultured marine virus]
MIYRERKRIDADWGFIMGYVPQEDAGGIDPENPGRITGSINNQKAPYIWKAYGDDIEYGFGSGDNNNYVLVEDVISKKGVWYQFPRHLTERTTGFTLMERRFKIILDVLERPKPLRQ